MRAGGLPAAGVAAVLPVTLALAAASPDPMARVPAWPTACYQSDGFEAKLSTADAAVLKDIERQEAINSRLGDRMKSIDPMQLAARQQQWMMDHPQDATRLMQRNADLGTQQASDIRMKSFADREKLAQDLKDIQGRYAAALAAALTPIDARFKDLETRAAKELVGEAGGYPDWAVREYNVLVQQENSAYEKVCATWWAPAGPFHGWLKRLREHFAADTPRWEEIDSVSAGFMVIVVGEGPERWQSPAGLKAAHELMTEGGRVFAGRRSEPTKPM